MIELYGYGRKVTRNKSGITKVENVLEKVPIVKLKNTATRKGSCGYYGYVENYSKYFPESEMNEGWVHIIKSMNYFIKLPVLGFGEEVEI